MATTLVELAGERQARLASAKAAAQQALTATQQTHAQAQTDYTEASAEVKTLDAEVASIRARLASIETPADGEPLLEELSQKIIALRSKQSEFIEVEETLRVRQAEMERANAELRQATTNLTSADAALADAVQQNERREALRKKLDEPPFDTLKDDITAALDEPLTAARKRVEGDIPEPLITRASDRRELEEQKLERSRLAMREAQDKSATELHANGGVAGRTERPRLEFERAGEDLRNYIVKSKERLDQALAMLAAVADAEKEPLTEAQKLLINDPDLQTPREDAATAEQERDEKLSAVRAIKIEIEQALLNARASDVDADPEDDDEVKEKRSALVEAESDLGQAEIDYTDEMRATMDQWEASVPDAAWRRLDALREAERSLNLLKEADPEQLKTAEASKEDALVAALSAADKSARTLEAIEAERASRATHYEFENAAAQRLLFSALRGDR